MPPSESHQRLCSIWWTLLWLFGIVFCGLVEITRQSDPVTLSSTLRWVAEFASDTPMYLPLFLLLPLAWWLRSGLVVHRTDVLRSCTAAWARWCEPLTQSQPQSRSSASWLRDRLLAFVIGAVSIVMSWQVSRSFGDLPPAYHDEYSYLFQARTLLAGQLSFPSHPALPELFDQMHVVNSGRFASRYFPGTGVWLAPWLAVGHPYWGQWLAGALTAMLMFWIGRELAGVGVGFLTGMLTALSPGLALFSNLLLAHHPTLLGLSLFLFGFIRWMNHRRALWLIVAGCGLSFAMLCRPATAAGVGLPFGIWFVCWLVKSEEAVAMRLRAALMLGLPIVVGWGVMAAYDSAITGHWWQSPYQLYTDHYTPRHVYGFNNVERGAEKQGARILPVVTRNYDAWAENLTPALAVKNTGNRLVASWRWTLGLMPIVAICLAGAGLLWKEHPGWKLIGAAIITLHAIHVPYWFDGIMHWHYVFESSVLWLLLVAGSVGALIRKWNAADRPWLIAWMAAFLSVSIMTNYVAWTPYWVPRLSVGISELRYSRRIYGVFQQRLRTEVTELPALVLVIPDPADRHMDFVTNDPRLSAPILLGRYVPAESDPDRLQQIAKAFPDRQLYVYDAKTRQLDRLIP